MKKAYLFLSAFLISLPFWIGINLLQKNAENLLSSKNKQVLLAAQISPAPNQPATTTPACLLDNITASSFLVLKVDAGQNDKIIIEKNSEQKLPIASLTKLMTYAVASEFYKNSQSIIIAKEAVEQPDATGIIKEGDVFSVGELAPIMLVESNNEAAFALTEVIGQEGFLDLMNYKAKELGLNSTHFYNPTGADPEALKMPPDQINYSTALDIAKLSGALILNYPNFLPIVSQVKYPLYKDGKLAWYLQSTNELLGAIPEVIGGKTGTTDRAGQCFMAIAKTNKENEYLIAVVLNSKNRFEEMKTLLSCAKEN